MSLFCATVVHVACFQSSIVQGSGIGPMLFAVMESDLMLLTFHVADTGLCEQAVGWTCASVRIVFSFRYRRHVCLCSCTFFICELDKWKKVTSSNFSDIF